MNALKTYFQKDLWSPYVRWHSAGHRRCPGRLVERQPAGRIGGF